MQTYQRPLSVLLVLRAPALVGKDGGTQGSHASDKGSRTTIIAREGQGPRSTSGGHTRARTRAGDHL